MKKVIPILELLTEGTRRKQGQDAIKELGAIGTLRGGSGGWLSEEKDYCTGTCPRMAWARSKGYLLEDNTDKMPMFQAGHHSEDGLLELIGLSWPGTIQCEEEIPIRWETSNGMLVTGRPDIVLGQGGVETGEPFVPQQGIEAKLVSSLWTALQVLREPKVSHLIQAAHYSHILGIPWSLLYVNRTNWALLSDFALKKAPRQGDVGSEHVQYVDRKKKIKDKKTGKEKTIEFVEGKMILPFYSEYPFFFNEHGELSVVVRQLDEYGQEPENITVPTFIDWEGIKRYYELVSRIDETGDVGPKPTDVDIFGGEKGYSLCSYCPLGNTDCAKKKISLDDLRRLCDKQDASIKEQLQRKGSKHGV